MKSHNTHNSSFEIGEITMKLTIGADPELFIKDNKSGKLISAAGLFPGTKEAPHPVMHGAVQVDGMAAEYNILPASTYEEFVFNNISVLRSLRDIIKEHNPGLDFDFVFNPVADFGAEYIAQQSEVAKALGCTPDYNAYDKGKPNPIPDAEMPFRTASGHIHLGWTKDQDINDPEHIEACIMMTKQLDTQIGIYMLELEGNDGKRRRELYGKAGAFRPKHYGVEYRTPSNVWLTKPYLMRRVFAQSKAAFDQLIDGVQYYTQTPWVASKDYINTHDTKNVQYYIGGSWNAPGYREDTTTVGLATLDKLFLKYCGADTTGLVTKDMISELRLSLKMNDKVEVGNFFVDPAQLVQFGLQPAAAIVDDIEDDQPDVDEDDFFIEEDEDEAI
jgi:hypothetical protein